MKWHTLIKKNGSIAYLDEVMKEYKIKDDSDLARLIGISRQSISQYRERVHAVSIQTAAKVANLLGINPMGPIACTMWEQAEKDEDKEFWKEMFKKFSDD